MGRGGCGNARDLWGHPHWAGNLGHATLTGAMRAPCQPDMLDSWTPEFLALYAVSPPRRPVRAGWCKLTIGGFLAFFFLPPLNPSMAFTHAIAAQNRASRADRDEVWGVVWACLRAGDAGGAAFAGVP